MTKTKNSKKRSISRRKKSTALRKKSKSLKPTGGIRLEPRKLFDPAIVAVSVDGWPVYSYRKLLAAAFTMFPPDEPHEDVVEYVDYNIIGLACNGFGISYK